VIGIFTFWVMVITDCIINKIMLNIVACLPTYLSVRHSICSAEISDCHRLELRVVMSFLIFVKIKWKMSLNFISLSIKHLPIKWSSILHFSFLEHVRCTLTHTVNHHLPRLQVLWQPRDLHVHSATTTQ